MKRAARGMMHGAVAAAVPMCLVLGGCRTGQVTVVEKVRVDTLRLSRNIRDSVVVRDSVYVKEAVRGDTVWLEVTRWRERERDRVRVDTVYRAKVDSVPVVVEVEKRVEVERKRRWWEKGLMWIGGTVVAGMGAFLLFKIKRLGL